MTAMLRRYYDTLSRSCSDPTLYREVLEGKPVAGYGYLYWTLWLCSLLSAFAFVGWALAVFPSVREFTAAAERSTAELFPAQLEVTIQNGKVRTNAREPVVIDLPKEWTASLDDEDRRLAQRDGEYPHMLVIDTSASAEDFLELHTIALLTEKSLVMADKENSLRIVPLQDVDDVVVNRALYDDLRGGLLKLLAFLPAVVWTCVILLLLVIPFFAAAGWMLGYLLSLLVWTLLLWILNRWVGPRLTYGRLYRLSIPGLTVVISVDLLAQWVGASVPFLSTVVYLGWMTYILSALPTAAPAATPAVAPRAPKKTPGRKIAKTTK